MFWTKKPKYYSLEFFSVVSLEEAQSLNIGEAAKFLSEQMTIFCDQTKVKYSINYGRQSFTDSKKLDNLLEYSNSPEVVEITCLHGQAHFSISNFLLNQERPSKSGPIFLIIYLERSLWNLTSYLEFAKRIAEEFKVVYGFMNNGNGKSIELTKGTIPGNRIIEMLNGHPNRIYTLNLLNENQINSQFIKPLMSEFGKVTPFNSKLTLWSLSDNELKTLKKEIVTKNGF